MKSLTALITLFIKSNQYSLTKRQRITIFRNLFALHLKSKFYKSPGEVSRRLHSFTVHAYDYPSLINLYTEIFLKQVYLVKLKTNKPFIIDCGANIGLSVLFFKKCYPESVIWAFEPNPNSFQLLEKNVIQNQLQDVKLFNYALSSINSVVPFFVPLKKASLNGSLLSGFSESQEIRVETRKLSDLIKGVKVDFIKMDIEGGEVAVIQDLVNHDSLGSINEVIVEYHQKASPIQLNEFLNHFNNWKFTYQVVSEDVERNVILHFYQDSGILK